MLTKIALALAGIGLMYYEKVVDENMTAAESARKEYKASCDMKVDLLFTEQEFSCSTILKSDYAVGFGFLQNVNIYEFFYQRYPKIYYFIFKTNNRETNTEIIFRSCQSTVPSSSQIMSTVSGTTSSSSLLLSSETVSSSEKILR